jgi:hypothetical protein
MGYDLHITRAEHWYDGQAAISADEWLACVATDPELELAGFNGPYFALWSGPSRPEEPWFDWSRGRIHTKNPDPAMVGKALRIAERLGARVVGDDGEVYLADGQVEVDGVADTSPAMDWRAWK